VEINGKQQWQESFTAYKALIRDPHLDSDYLRRTGLQPHLIDLVGDVRNAHVLDAGCGTGWLFDSIDPLRGAECDLILPAQRRDGKIRSQCQDVRALTYDDDSFDVVVSSLVLMWVDDLLSAMQEAFRVTRPGGRLIVSIMHPYFHTHGYTLHDGSFLIDGSLGEPTQREVMISGVVGPLTYYARPLVDYYNAAVQAGWRLMLFRDHFIDMDRYRTEAAGLRSLARRTDKVPLFTFFVAHKDPRPGDRTTTP